jgi:BlaI family transcriptional regulator, penicillinase repressor
MSTKRVPNSELLVLQVLWREPSQTAKQVSDALKAEGKEVSVSSVQTLLRRLEGRGLVQHDQEGKAFLYSAACEPNAVRVAHARDLLDRMFGGAISGFVTQLIDEEEISDEELRELRDLVDSKLKEKRP